MTESATTSTAEPITHADHGTDHHSTHIRGHIGHTKSTEATTVHPVTKTEPPMTSTAEPIPDVPVTQTVTDVSGEPATTSSAQQVSGVTEEDTCPALLARSNLPCRCPFDAGDYIFPSTTFEIPDLGSLAALAKVNEKLW